MKLRESKTFRIFGQPMLFAVLGCLPLWLVAKFIVKTDLASSPYVIVIFVIAWLTFIAGSLIREKPEKERERILWRFFTTYSKISALYIGIVFLLLLVLLLAGIFKK